MAIESFVGPLTAGAISDWLSRCEEDFEAYNDTNPNTSLTSKQKIHKAMASVSRTLEDSKRISTWYTQNRRTLDNDDWDTFRDKVKEHALGKGWRIKVLQDFYTYHQGSTSLADYIAKFAELGYTVARTSKLTEVDDTAYKCHLLFNSRPELVQKFINEKKSDQQFIDYDISDITAALQDFDAEVPAPTPTPTPAPANASTSSSTSSSTTHLPTSPSSLGHLGRVWCYYNLNSTKPQIQLIQLDITSIPIIRLPSVYHDLNNYDHINLKEGEYLTQVIVTRDSSLSAVTSIRLITSLNNTPFKGAIKGETMAFTAPEGWRIVGFHGTAGSSVTEGGVTRYPITKLGVVYAPILP
ncbi:hypothetical protein F5Y16DRAFT_419063 [Xylariaceae sp. FL0255]|nr:hypothetical protein F5Y16DRAFT_419063 [Xylariaceae sp. FL0255]